jgi:hypothetical protein
MLLDQQGRVDFELVELSLALTLGLATYSLMHDGGLAVGWAMFSGFLLAGSVMGLSFGRALLQGKRGTGGETVAILLPFAAGGAGFCLARLVGIPLPVGLTIAAATASLAGGLCWWALRRRERPE